VAPPIVWAVKVREDPAHTGELEVTVGVDGIEIIFTATVPLFPAHPATVTKTEYVPVAAVVVTAMPGFCEDEEKLFGPVQE
jgi:hypothetical protein